MNFVGIVHEPSPEPIVTQDEERNAKIAKYTMAEFALYDSGTNAVEDFARHAPFWREIANPDGTVNSAYGHLIWKTHSCGHHTKHQQLGYGMTPWQWAAYQLTKDKDSRQAFLRFSLPEHQWIGNKDQVCTMHGNFLIRNDRLHLTIVMRSNDVVKGLVYDMPWFCSLMFRMQHELVTQYPDLKVGTYTHIAHSLHVYERDLPLVYSMLGQQP